MQALVGGVHANRDSIEAWFRRYGYAIDPDERLTDTLARFQRAQGIHPSGRLNAPTRHLLSCVRCSYGDVGDPFVEGQVPSVASVPHLARAHVRAKPETVLTPALPGWQRIPYRWNRRALRYCLVGGTPAGPEGWDPVRRAFATWSSSGLVDISESNDAVSAEIRVMWAYAGGGTDGPGGAVAKGWYPKWSLGELAGDLHFDGAETWTAAADIETDAHGIEAVALHEIGHCLGLGHCSDPDSVMHFEYKRGAHVLTSVDLTAIGAKYADVLLA